MTKLAAADAASTEATIARKRAAAELFAIQTAEHIDLDALAAANDKFNEAYRAEAEARSAAYHILIAASAAS